MSCASKILNQSVDQPRRQQPYQFTVQRLAHHHIDAREAAFLKGFAPVLACRFLFRGHDYALLQVLTGTVRWPAALVHGLDLLVATWDPDRGLRRFPPLTTVDLQDEPIWR